MTTTTAPAQTGAGEPDGAELTEFEAIDVKSIKGVKQGANGFPHLIMKGLPGGDADAAPEPPAWFTELSKAVVNGHVDETPDISLARQVMTLLGQAIGNEAQELAAGKYGEVRDIGMLSRASEIIACWQAREEAVAAGQDPDASCGCCSYCTGIGCGCCPGCGYGIVMCSAVEVAKSTAEINNLPDSAFAYIEPGGSKDGEGKTTPRKLRHFPVHDEVHARKAVQLLSTSPFGDKAKSKVMAAAKKFGIEVDGASKSAAVAEGEDSVQDDQQGSDRLEKAVADAVTKAAQPVLDRLASKEAELDGLLAKVKATPIPGGPVLSSNAVPIAGHPEGIDHAAKSAFYRQMAETVTDRVTADGYRKLARDEAAKAEAAQAT